MAHGTAFNPQTTSFARSDGASPEVYTAIAEVQSINFSGRVLATRDTSSLDNADQYRTKRGTMIDPGTVQLGLKLNLAELEKLEDDMEAHAGGGDPTNYRCTYLSGVTEILPGLMTDVSRTGSNDEGEWTASVTITLAGKPAYTPPA